MAAELKLCTVNDKKMMQRRRKKEEGVRQRAVILVIINDVGFLLNCLLLSLQILQDDNS